MSNRRASVALVAVAALLVSGVAAFLGVHALRGGQGAPTSCGALTCLTTVNDASLIPPLQARGFACSREGTSIGEDVRCELNGGSVDYQLGLESLGAKGSGGLTDYDLQVTYDSSTTLLPPVTAFVSWAASLPFPRAAPGASAASSWAVRQVKSVANAKTTIDGYQYAARGQQRSAHDSSATLAVEADEHIDVHPVRD